MPIAAAIGGSAILGAVVGSKSSSDARKASAKAQDKATTQTQAGASQARADLFKLFPAAQQNLQQGFQGAADIFGQAVPQQANVFQQGNVAAQQQIAQGLPQFQNAILGQPVDFSQFQPTQLQQPDFGFLQAQLPQAVNPFAPPPEIIGPQPQQQGGFNQLIHPLSGNFNNQMRP